MLLRNFFGDEEDTYWASIYRVVEESRHASPNLMAGTLLASSPHYFSAVEDYHACLMKTWLPCGAHKIYPNHIVTNFVQPAYVEKIPYSMPMDSWHPWVVKWATLRKPKQLRIGPQGAPRGPEWKTQAYMNHQRKTYRWGFACCLNENASISFRPNQRKM